MLQINNLLMRFGGLTAINKLDLEVEKGQILGLIGPNGAGKTTVFNCISRLVNPSEGKIIMNGVNLLELPPYKIIDHGIARTFQNIQLFNNLTILDNLLISQHAQPNPGVIAGLLRLKKSRDYEIEIRERAMKSLKLMGIDNIANLPAKALPLGTRKLIELARALTMSPKLMLLDEPVAGMNSDEIANLARYVKDIRDKDGITIFLVEHTMKFVMNVCDKICVINYGKKIAEGNPKEILENEHVIGAYLGKGIH